MSIKKIVALVAWVVTVVLVSLHVNQSIVRSSGEMIPGDLGDGRFNNYVMEHDYLSLLGYYDWFSPGQFFPQEKTLFYSDNHWGSVGFYMPFRALGVSVEGSFQAWFLVVGALNALALLYLFRTLRVRLWIACPLTFFGVSSFALAFKLGHAQVLLLFPFILSLAFFIQFLKFRDVRKLAFSVLLYVYQHYCYMYYGYLMTLVYAFLLLAFIPLCTDRAYWAEVWNSFKQNRGFLAVVFSVAGGAIAVLYLPYALNNAGRPSLGQLSSLAPRLGSWWSASPHSLFYKAHFFNREGASAIESTLFYGYAVWGLMFASLVYCVRLFLKKGKEGIPFNLRLGLSLFLSGVLLAAFVTTWFSSWGNLYLIIPACFEPTRAFRSFGRVVYLLIIVDAVAAGLFLNYWLNTKARSVKVLAVGVALFFAVESIATSQPHAYSKSEAQSRRSRLALEWENSADGDVLLFAPASPDAPFYVIQLDAWGAALSRHKKTVNGYSGNFPETHKQFILDPLPENAQFLLEQLEVDNSRITILN